MKKGKSLNISGQPSSPFPSHELRADQPCRHVCFMFKEPLEAVSPKQSSSELQPQNGTG